MRNKAITIRPAKREDFDAIEALHKAAFSVSDFGYNGEGLLARQLHETGDAVVSLLAEVEGTPVGHVLFSHMRVEADGHPLVAALLAPLGVVPEWQDRGIGADMIKAGLAALKPQGVQLVFVVGSTNYYPRFGFNVELAKPFESPYTGPYFMALSLDTNLPVPSKGTAEFAALLANF